METMTQTRRTSNRRTTLVKVRGKRPIYRKQVVYEARGASGEAKAAQAFIRPFISADMTAWSETEWVEIGRAFSGRFKWQWSSFFALMMAEALSGGVQDLGAITRAYRRAEFNAFALAGTPSSCPTDC